jgi:hypothetical protein
MVYLNGVNDIRIGTHSVTILQILQSFTYIQYVFQDTGLPMHVESIAFPRTGSGGFFVGWVSGAHPDGCAP